MATLERLENLVMEMVLSKLAPENVATLACASPRLRDAAADEVVWRAFCVRELDLEAPLDPDGNRCPSFKVTYQRWRESFAIYPWQLVIRAKKCWSDKKSWLAANFPEAAQTLQKGASEDEIMEVEMKLHVNLPLPTRLLYRFCNGQDTSNAHRNPAGIIGGYCFYDHLVNVHLLPLRKIVEETIKCKDQLGFSSRSKYIIVAMSYFVEKVFLLNCTTGQLYVGTRNLFRDGDMVPCVPSALLSSEQNSDGGTVQDGMLLWLEEHTRSLQRGLFGVRVFYRKKMICLFPEAPPQCTTAITNGVKIRASAVFVPEMCDLNAEEDSRHWFAYSIRMSLSPEGCILDGIHYDSCQLYSRHWIIRSNDAVVSDLRGEAVIGKDAPVSRLRDASPEVQRKVQPDKILALPAPPAVSKDLQASMDLVEEAYQEDKAWPLDSERLSKGEVMDMLSEVENFMESRAIETAKMIGVADVGVDKGLKSSVLLIKRRWLAGIARKAKADLTG